jgi:hypothetical protein
MSEVLAVVTMKITVPGMTSLYQTTWHHSQKIILDVREMFI